MSYVVRRRERKREREKGKDEKERKGMATQLSSLRLQYSLGLYDKRQEVSYNQRRIPRPNGTQRYIYINVAGDNLTYYTLSTMVRTLFNVIQCTFNVVQCQSVHTHQGSMSVH